MSQHSLRPVAGWAGLLVASVAVTACGGGGSGAGSDFAVAALTVQPNATIQINRQLEFTFTEAVDFDSVSLNTISISQVGGGPAAGEFRVKTRKVDPLDPCSALVTVPNVIVFQPACPTLDDFSDAGFVPGGFQYQINIVGSSSGGLTVRSQSGKSIGSSQTLNFTTPVSTQATVLFVDPVVNSAPRAVIADPTCTSTTASSYLELGGSSTNRVRLVKRPVADPVLGAALDATDFLAPLNLYSDPNSSLGIVLQIDQPVNPSTANVSSDTLRLEYLTDEGTPELDAAWINIPHTVALEQNCSELGAVVRITPTGLLPQGRLLRVRLMPDFRDIVGNGNILPVVVVTFRARTATDPGTTTPGLAVDMFTESFNVGGTTTGSNQDTTALLDAPPAEWGGGDLTSTFNFGGTGGSGGAFVWRVRQVTNGTTVFNTSFQSITNEDSTISQPCVDGQVDVKDFIVDAGAVLEVRGPKPMVVRASGRVEINGKILLRGSNSRGVQSYSSANLPEAGGSGTAGGGRGGTGSLLTNQSDPKGENGLGAFGLLNGGGAGGDSAFGTAGAENMRPGGGGGGSFAIDVQRVSNAAVTTRNTACAEQFIIGLDAEDGADGAAFPGAQSAVTPGSRPKGGVKGPRPFQDLNPTDAAILALDAADDTGSPFQPLFNLNDFWGSMLAGSTIIRGELGTPWAGAGGGGGGDIIQSATFPATPFNPVNDKKGAGGGGGGGSFTLLCLGDIKFGAAGRIEANGGLGGGGENTSGVNRVGGGSGGGSGGHIILQAGGVIDFSACVAGNYSNNFSSGAAILARGGEGGEGANGVGGANPPATENGPQFDQLPTNSYPNTSAPCGVGTVANMPPANTVGTQLCTGGDGGPGVIQLHVSDPSKIIKPTTAPTTGNWGATNVNALSRIIQPNPVGTTVLNRDTPASWKRLLPIFGRESKAVSKWIPLGNTSVPPTGTTPKNITFFFGGTSTVTGKVQASGGLVPDLPSILTATLATQPSLPYITADKRSLVVDATTFTDDIYVRNPGILKQFELVIGTSSFEVASATYDAGTNTVRVTVGTSGIPLNGLTGALPIEIHPRFFRVSENGVADALSSSSEVKIEFQAAPVAASGLPNETAATPWVTDIAALNTTVTPANTALRFFRFRVSFTIGIGQASLNFDTPIPSLDFLKVPFKF